MNDTGATDPDSAIGNVLRKSPGESDFERMPAVSRCQCYALLCKVVYWITPFITTLKAKFALITGASRGNGIGAATRRALAMQGANILFTTWQAFDREQPHGAGENGPMALEQALLNLGVKVRRLEIDLAYPDSAAQVLDAALEWLGLPDVLVNNAAHSTHDGFELLDAAKLDAHYAVNMRATFLLAAEFARRAKALGRLSGHIISMSSGQDWGPMPGELAYAATKGAIEAFNLSLASELAPLGLR
jgi:3-oxoacyl-[acyl-carrier protein] reductase